MPSSESASRHRLDSWKEIAAYLNREVRTIQRWEAKEGLPIHRHMHDAQVTVYAFAAELDEWLANRRPSQDNGEPAAALPARTSWFVRLHLPTLGVVALILLVGGGIWVGTRAVGARLGFQARDSVLLTGFENRTGESVFDGTLQYALDRELSNSRYVNVVTRERVEDALRLMRKDLDTKIDMATAREICLRDGGIKAVVTGRAEKLGSTYVFTIQLVEPREGRTLAMAEEHATGQEQIWSAVRKLSNWVRLSLGEQLAGIQPNNELQHVTTPSLRALQLYSEAEALGRADSLPRQWGTSEQLVRQALDYDPEFASGWIWLAWCLRNQGKPPEECRPFAEKAVALSAKASERERLFILGSYYGFFTGDREKAVEAYAALLRLYPDDFWAKKNLIYVGTGLELRGLLVSYADSRPNNFPLNAEAAITLAASRDVAAARRYLDRAKALMTPETERLFPAEETEVDLLPVHQAWLSDDPKSGVEELSRFERSYHSMDPMRQQLFARHVGLCYLGFGKVKEGVAWFRKIESEARLHSLLALAAYASGDKKWCSEEAQEFFSHPGSEGILGSSAGVALARVGPISDPLHFIEHFKNIDIDPGLRDHVLLQIKGELALSQGKTAEAIGLLKQAVDNFRQDELQDFLPASDGLALALERNGQGTDALRVLEEASNKRTLELAWDSQYGVFWLRIQAHLAQLYRQAGRSEDARKVEDQLRRILAYADPDHPILIQLRRSS